MTKQSIVISVLGVSVLAATLSARADAGMGDPAKLISLSKCVMCHKKPEVGEQYAKWQATGHAKAFELLASDEAKAVGAKLGIADPQTSGKCLKCHSTAYFFTETKQTEEIDVANGVTCQSCHGPGADYKKKEIMQDLQLSIANGMIHPAKEKACTKCHNDSNPTWKPDRYQTAAGPSGFDVEQAFEKIKHPKPAK